MRSKLHPHWKKSLGAVVSCLTMIKAAVRKRKFQKGRKQKRTRTDMDHLKNKGEQEMTARRVSLMELMAGNMARFKNKKRGG